MTKEYSFDNKSLGDIIRAYYKDTANITLHEVIIEPILDYDFESGSGIALKAQGKGTDDFAKIMVPFEVPITMNDILTAISHYVEPTWLITDFSVQAPDSNLWPTFESLKVSYTAKEKQKKK